jgi:ribose/xylose/arabinose/galactoside ABC-type transport system permease subunit
LQPFIVTLCGLMLYRGIARGLTGDRAPGFGSQEKFDVFGNKAYFWDVKYLASGRPFEMTWFIAVVGVLVVVWAFWPWRQRDRERAMPRVVPAVIGIILALVGMAPLWWPFKADTTAIDPDAFAAMSFWSRSRTEFRIAEPMQIPALLFFWIGLVLFAGSLIWFVVRSLGAGKKAILPLGAAVVATVAGFFVCRSAINAWPEAVDGMLQMPKMWIVLRLAAGLGTAAAALTWFASSSLRNIGPTLRTPFFLAIAGGVMCLLGFAPIPALRVPMPFLIMLALAIAAAILLNNTIWGRYLLALGRNEQAARYSGVDTHSMIILAYVICSLLAGLGGMLFVLDVNSAQPADFGNFYELYAIAAAVLGGCSLRGGEGTIAGVVIGAAVMQILKNSITLLDFPTHIEYAIIGAVLLIGVITDEFTKRVAARRRDVPPGFPIAPLAS